MYILCAKKGNCLEYLIPSFFPFLSLRGYLQDDKFFYSLMLLEESYIELLPKGKGSLGQLEEAWYASSYPCVIIAALQDLPCLAVVRKTAITAINP